MTIRKFKVGDKVRYKFSGCLTDLEIQYVEPEDFDGKLVYRCDDKKWYFEDEIEFVSSTVTNETLDVQTCIDFLLSNGYKVTLEKL